jgi:hypothetical protein
MKPYLDFELSIQREGEGYRTRVLKAPAGEAAGAFTLPFSDLEIENFLLRIGGRRQTMRRINSPEVQAARTFGEGLFRAAFPEGVRDCLRGSLDAAESQGTGLRIRIRLNEVPELAELPWEYLWDPMHRRFLALSTNTPIVRYLEIPERIRPLEVKPPLRILAMISSPAGYPLLDVEQEWARLGEALAPLTRRGLVTLDRLEQSTLMALRRQLRQTEYHILHFVGHGGFDERAQDGVLVLEDQQGRARLVDGQSLSTMLRDRTTLRLAVLNSCEGARATRTDPFAGTAQSLVQGSIPAAIAMQFEISDDAAITFAAELYRGIAEGLPVDTALAEARLAIFAEGNGLEWGTPVLYLRAPNGRIFEVEADATTPKRASLALVSAEEPSPPEPSQPRSHAEPARSEPPRPIDLSQMKELDPPGASRKAETHTRSWEQARAWEQTSKIPVTLWIIIFFMLLCLFIVFTRAA